MISQDCEWLMSLVMTHNATTLHTTIGTSAREHAMTLPKLVLRWPSVQRWLIFAFEMPNLKRSWQNCREKKSSSNYLSDTNTPTVQLEPGVDAAMPFLGAFFCKNNTAIIRDTNWTCFLFLHTACMVTWYALQWHLGIYGDTVRFRYILIGNYSSLFGSRGENALFSPVDVRLLLRQCRWQKSRKSRGFFSSFLILLS